MKKTLPTLWIYVLVYVLTASSLTAYDSHHPDPMSFLNGTHRATRHKPKPEPEENNATKIQKWRMFKMHKEGKYVIKPEPYSLASKKADPELLGPQRTFKKAAQAAVPTPPDTTKKTEKTTITKESCIQMIGQEKFDTYVEKYGGESGALHRCLVLKRMQGT